jgi:hypothetical protein
MSDVTFNFAEVSWADMPGPNAQQRFRLFLEAVEQALYDGARDIPARRSLRDLCPGIFVHD